MNTRIVVRLILVLCAGFLATTGWAAAPKNGGRTEVNLSGAGWSLWQDTQAPWKDDELFLPPVDLNKVPINPPTGGWTQLAAPQAIAVAVPGTIEEYLVKNPNPSETSPGKLYGNLRGVSWWFRTVHIPESTGAKRYLLKFDAVRLRAEVYINQKLVAYDVIGNTPFDVDLSGLVKPGEDCQLAVRVTNPGGNWSWEDFQSMRWGQYAMPASHSFGGITGNVKLLALDPVYVDDVYIQNTPEPRKVNVITTVCNTTADALQRDLLVRVVEKKNPKVEMFRTEVKGVKLAPSSNTVSVEVSVPNAKLWDLENPNLYVCETAIKSGDAALDRVETTFGFRWFAADGVDTNAMFRLNGKRIVLRSAISWGFWPINGIMPNLELAARQVRMAKTFGLNMLNFHRTIGTPNVLDQADEQGLLYFEEPGGYVGGGKTAFGQAVAREKLLRMVKRDRNHPALIITNMINEQWDNNGGGKDEAMRANFKRDIQAAHAIDPSRIIVFASAWAKNGEDFVKMHMRPFDNTVHFKGWWDSHRADGPDTWLESFYTDPKNHYGMTKNASEVVYWGEEGAISTPPRLALIKSELEKLPRPGWDGDIYLGWYKSMDDFLTRKKLRGAFSTVDKLCVAMGNVSMEHQGRKIEDTRICDLNDGYAVNGWEAEPFENHSGIVDEFRNSKGDPAIIAYYNQPLYIAVKVRRQVYQMPDTAIVDFYAINEKNLQGDFTLKMTATDSAKKKIFSEDRAVKLQGGDVYGQMLCEGVKVPITGMPGMVKIEARLVDAKGKERATGRDQVLSVDWKSDRLAGKGAVYEEVPTVSKFLKEQMHIDAPIFDDKQGKLDWLVVSRRPAPALRLIADNDLIDADGKPGGITTTFYKGSNFKEQLAKRTDNKVDFNVEFGAPPDPAVPLIENYGVCWEGQVVPPTTGNYTFALDRPGQGAATLFVNGKEVINIKNTTKSRVPQEATVDLEAGKPVSIKAQFLHGGGQASVQLFWLPPNQTALDPAVVLKRATDDGTTIILVDYVDQWMDALKTASPNIKYSGKFNIGNNWKGGQFFVKEHPLFSGLPTNCALNWPYQELVKTGRSRYGLMLEGEELVCGAYHTMGCKLGTSVGIAPCGKGKVIVSTLAICPNLAGPVGPADVARKLLCNYIKFASPVRD